jgi:uncharacterized peroxidase-related enzyme
MSYVKLVSGDEAPPGLRKTYDAIRSEFGFLPNFMQALGRTPALLDGQMTLHAAALSDGALSARLKEQIGLVVSGLNSSSYCIAVHMEMLRKLGVEKQFGKKLATDYENAPASDKEKVLFRFAAKLTRRPYDFSRKDVEAVYAAGWNEQALFELVMTVAYFNYINAVSIGLGLVADF